MARRRRCDLSNRATESRALELHCPSCGAVDGEDCVTKPDETGRMYATTTHVPRLIAARTKLDEERQERHQWQITQTR